MKITVLYDKELGHVLAAVTRVAPVEFAAPGPDDAVAPEVRALAGDSLPVRGFPNVDLASPSILLSEFRVDASRLAVLTSDGEDAQLRSPHDYVVKDGKELVLPPANTLPGVAATAGRTGVKLTLSPGASSPLPFALFLVPHSGIGATFSRFGVFTPPVGVTHSDASFNLGAVLVGTYDALVLLQGYAAGIRQLT